MGLFSRSGSPSRQQSDARSVSEETVRVANNDAFHAKKQKKSAAEQQRLQRKADDVRKAHESLYGPIR